MSRKVRFVGRDGSMGLKYGRLYDVQLEEQYGEFYAWVYKNGVYVSQSPYQSLVAFMNNWVGPKQPWSKNGR